MSLFSALNNAVTGLKANQVGLDVVSRNVANANTPGYTKKVAPRENAILAGDGSGVRVLPTTRDVDMRLLENLRSEVSRSERLGTVSDFLTRIDEMFGRPDQETSIAYGVNELAIKMGELVDNPENAGVRASVVAQADMVARQLNQMSASIQDMRTEAERGIATAVDDVNAALQGIADLNREIANREAANLTVADLQDRRDAHLETVARNLDIRTVERPDGAITVFTTSGHTLVSERAAQIAFDSREVLTAFNTYSREDEARSVGTLTLLSPGGSEVDLLKDGPPRQGRIAGLLELRDERLPEAQAQLDEIAHSLALGMADRVTDFQVDSATGVRSMDFTSMAETAVDYSSDPPTVQKVEDGDRMVVDYTLNGVQRRMTVYFVEDANDTKLLDRVPDPDNALFVDIATPPLPADNDGLAERIWQAMDASELRQVSAIKGAFYTESGPPPAVPAAGDDQLLAEGSLVTGLAINGITMRQATTDAVNGPALNLFADGNSPAVEQRDYTGRLSEDPWQKTGFAGRIGVTNAIAEDDTLLVRYQTATGEVPSGDNSRAMQMLDRLTEEQFTFNPDTGLGNSSHLFNGTLLDLGRAVVSYQGTEASTQKSLAEDQTTRTELLDQRHTSLTGVNVDDELAQLILLQSAYSASAKVVQTVDRLFEDLLSLR